jgi:hypothetical protein
MVKEASKYRRGWEIVTRMTELEALLVIRSVESEVMVSGAEPLAGGGW